MFNYSMTFLKHVLKMSVFLKGILEWITCKVIQKKSLSLSRIEASSSIRMRVIWTAIFAYLLHCSCTAEGKLTFTAFVSLFNWFRDVPVLFIFTLPRDTLRRKYAPWCRWKPDSRSLLRLVKSRDLFRPTIYSASILVVLWMHKTDKARGRYGYWWIICGVFQDTCKNSR